VADSGFAASQSRERTRTCAQWSAAGRLHDGGGRVRAGRRGPVAAEVGGAGVHAVDHQREPGAQLGGAARCDLLRELGQPAVELGAVVAGGGARGVRGVGGLLSPTELADRLDAALGAPGAGARDAPARQQTLRATIDWSHELLSDAEQQCFARFAVFAGGATIEAAETITAGGLDTLDGLVAKSLLARRQHAFAPTRLGMLETIRAYAGERFAAAPDVEAVREDHYRYYLALAERHGTERALWGAGAREHLGRLDAENVGLAALLTGMTDTASHAFREELTLCRDMVVRPVLFEGLRGLAAVAVVHGDDTRAATLVGAADAHRHAQTDDPVEARLERAFFEPARTRCETYAWNAAAREGGALTFEDAIAYALVEPPV